MPTLHLEPVLHRLRLAAAPESTDTELLARFAARRDETAFAALVRRHGPLVQNVCRRVLGNEHDAEDAFQATFLLLARKAGSLATPELLGNWLHGVAYRIACRARADSARRRVRESRASGSEPVEPDESVVWREVRGVLDEELSRLPERYRVPLVLCYLEGRTNAEAALRLGCSRGTVATRLARGRERLKGRLTRRGLPLPAGLASLVLTHSAASAALESATVRAAILFAADNLHAAGPVAAQAASLAKGVANAMLLEKVKVTVAVLLTGFALAGAGLLARHASADQPPTAEEKPAARRARAVGQPAPQLAVSETPASQNTATKSDAGPTATQPESAAPGKKPYLSANFEVAAPTAAIARQIGRAAEERRKALALLWLGRELPAWQKRCPIRVKITDRGEGGATTFHFEKGKVVSQEMDLEGRLENIQTDLLPHEITHTILAHHFGRGIPRWADEGAAQLSESATSGGRHERALQKVLSEGRLLPLRRLLALREYPKDVLALFAQGYSLTEFLVRAEGRAKFLEFLSSADRDGWDKAVKTHYGHARVEDLEKAWLASLGEGRSGRSAAEAKPASGRTGWSAPRAARAPRGKLAAGPRPEQALVALEDDGRLWAWRAGPSYTTVLLGSFPLDQVKVHDTRGNVIEPAEVAERLSGETLALISSDGRAVDPLHLRLVKEGTLVFVLPPSSPPQVTPSVAPTHAP